jgi:hypothetical protein
MYGFFKFVLYLGVAMGLVAFAMLYVKHPMLADLPPMTRTVLSFGGLGLIVIALIGRTLTRPSDDKVEWK